MSGGLLETTDISRQRDHYVDVIGLMEIARDDGKAARIPKDYFMATYVSESS